MVSFQSRGKKLGGVLESIVAHGSSNCCTASVAVICFWGMRSQGNGRVELLPHDPDPEALPEEAKGRLFEDLSAEDFAIFLPVVDRFAPYGQEELQQSDGPGIGCQQSQIPRRVLFQSAG